MKKSSKGKWLTREVVWEREPSDGPITREEKSAIIKQGAEEMRTLDRFVEKERQRAAAFLRSRDLPDAAWVHSTVDDPDEWKPGKATQIGGVAGQSFTFMYLEKGLSYEPDSVEVIAAKILFACWGLEHEAESQGEALSWAYLIGRRSQLFEAYLTAERKQLNSEGRKKGREKQQADAKNKKELIRDWALAEFRSNPKALANPPTQGLLKRLKNSSVAKAANQYADSVLMKELRAARSTVRKELKNDT